MTKKDADFTKITRDPSFLRIAKAINQATVWAGEVKIGDRIEKLDWQRKYGLAQQPSSQAGSEREFVCAIADFLGDYESENLRLSEQMQKQKKSLKRVWRTKKDLDKLIEIIDEFDHVLVANLLIAYGYAKWTKAKEEPLAAMDDKSSETDEVEDTEEQE